MMIEQKKYYGLDWLRTIACFGIVLYLCHMVMFRIVEKLHLNAINSGWSQYLIIYLLVLVFAIVFSFCDTKSFKYCHQKIGVKINAAYIFSGCQIAGRLRWIRNIYRQVN